MRKTVVVFALAAFVTLMNASEITAQDPRAAVQAALARLAPNRVLPNDLILTGQLSDSSGTRLFRITIKGKDQARYEVGTGAATVTTIFFRGTGWTQVGNKVQMSQPYTAMQRPFLMPFLDLLNEADNPGLQIADRGTLSLGNLVTRRFTLTLRDPSPRTRMFARPLDEETEVYVDPISGVVVRSERSIMSENNMNVRIRMRADFSDYRVVQGFAIPFRIVTATVGSGPPAQSVYVILDAAVNSGIADLVEVRQEPSR